MLLGARHPGRKILVPRVCMVTPFRSKCGIASYVERMLQAWPAEASGIRVMALRERSINPFHFLSVGLESARDCDIIHVQYQRGLFGMLLPLPLLSYITHFPAFFIGLMLAKGRRKVIYTIHEHNDRNPWQRLMLELIKISADRYIVHSRELARILSSSGIPTGKIDVYPMPCEKGVRIDAEEAKRRLGLEGKRVALLFGYAHRNKGYDLAVRALAGLPEDVVLVIAGGPRNAGQDGYYRSLMRIAGECGVSKRVVFPGFVEGKDVPAFFSAADAGVLPYRWIQGSLALADFMAYGVPTITSDLAYFADIREEHGCIETFVKDDEKDLGKKLAALLEDGAKRKALGKKIAAYLDKANWEGFAAFSEAVYHGLA